MIFEAHGEGLGNRAISRKVGCHHRTVYYHLRRAGLQPNNPRGKPPVEVSETTAICTYCGREVPKTEFALLRSRADGRRLSKCRKCRREQNYRNLSSSIVAFTYDRQRRLKVRASKEGLPYDLPDGYLLLLYQRQNGKCFYTDAQLDTKVGAGFRPSAFSIDRVIPSKGYIVGNIVLCINRINSMKQEVTLDEMSQWMPLWFGRLVEAEKRGEISLS